MNIIKSSVTPAPSVAPRSAAGEVHHADDALATAAESNNRTHTQNCTSDVVTVQTRSFSLTLFKMNTIYGKAHFWASPHFHTNTNTARDGDTDTVCK